MSKHSKPPADGIGWSVFDLIVAVVLGGLIYVFIGLPFAEAITKPLWNWLGI